VKYLLVLLVVVVGLWLLLRGRGDAPRPPDGRRRGKPPAAEQVVACVHCGLHLPRADAVVDAAGRPYCSDAHRLAGPR
jgi:uncharacterized protein